MAGRGGEKKKIPLSASACRVFSSWENVQKRERVIPFILDPSFASLW